MSVFVVFKERRESAGDEVVAVYSSPKKAKDAISHLEEDGKTDEAHVFFREYQVDPD